MRVVESEAGPVGTDACTVESETEPVGADACTVESEAGPLMIDPVVSAVNGLPANVAYKRHNYYVQCITC